METGHNQDPGTLSPEDELALLALDEAYRNSESCKIFPSHTKELVYMMRHSEHPAGASDVDDSLNTYLFLVIGGKDQDWLEKSKAFMLTFDDSRGHFVRVFSVSEILAQKVELKSGAGDISAGFYDLERRFGEIVNPQTSLGTHLPNPEDMEDFHDIVYSYSLDVDHKNRQERLARMKEIMGGLA